MKKLILKPNAVNKGEVLTRAQLKKVMGGTGSEFCRVKVTNPDGTSGGWGDSSALYGNGSGANAACADYVVKNPGSRCQYDCDGDGWQS